MADQRLFTILLVGILWGCVLGLQRPAPRYSQQLMPDTSFSCRHKIVGSYYADPETDCQLFHVCVSVAGSIQDYRFLCPNDTAFDQESQTCADWYDVDCEAATLYYASDNFDLYRLGSGLESLHYDSVRNDVEPLDHLQRSESSDPVRSAANNLNKNNNNGDILKGSSSSNFFNNRNNGKEIDDYDNDGKAYREEKTVQEPRRKQGVRKVARKQQFDNNNNNNVVPTTGKPAAIPESNFGNNQNRNNNYQNNYQYNQQRQTTNNFIASSTTVRPYIEQNNNNNNNFGRNNQNNNNNQRYTAPPSTYRPTTIGNSYQENNNNNNNNNNGFTNQQNFNGFNSNKFPTTFSQTPASSTARPIDYNTNVATKKKAPEQSFTNQFNQFSTQSTTPRSSSTGYQATDYTTYQKNYNTILRTTNSGSTEATTHAANFYDDYAIAAARLNNAQNINKVSSQTRQQEISSQTTPRFTNNYAGSSYIPTTYSPVTKRVNNANQGQAVNRGNDHYNSGQYETTRTTNSGQYREKVTTNQQQQSSQVYRNTQSFDTTRPANSNNNDNSGQYREVQSTKAPKKVTQYENYETKFNFNDASSTKSFNNFDARKSESVAGFSPASVNKLAEAPVTLRPTTPVARRPAYNSPSTSRPSSSATNFAPQTTLGARAGTGSFTSVTPGPFSSTIRPAERQAVTTAKPKSAKKNDYDYAYYDNAGALEYDGIDLEQTSGLRETAKITRN